MPKFKYFLLDLDYRLFKAQCNILQFKNFLALLKIKVSNDPFLFGSIQIYLFLRQYFTHSDKTLFETFFYS
jgi:hypothetical protein